MSGIGEGAKTGAIIGCLTWLGADLVFFANTTIFEITVSVIDPLLAGVQFGVGGAAIAALLEKLVPHR